MTEQAESAFCPTPWQDLRDEPKDGQYADYIAFEKWMGGRVIHDEDLEVAWGEMGLLGRRCLYSIVTQALDAHPILPALRAAVAEIEEDARCIDIDRPNAGELGKNKWMGGEVKGLRDAVDSLRQHLRPWLEEKTDLQNALGGPPGGLSGSIGRPECRHLNATVDPLVGARCPDCGTGSNSLSASVVLANLRAALEVAHEYGRCADDEVKLRVEERDSARAALTEKNREIERLRDEA